MNPSLIIYELNSKVVLGGSQSKGKHNTEFKIEEKAIGNQSTVLLKKLW